MDGGQLKNVCLPVCLLSVCNEFVPNYLLNRWLIGIKFFYKN